MLKIFHNSSFQFGIILCQFEITMEILTMLVMHQKESRFRYVFLVILISLCLGVIIPSVTLGQELPQSYSTNTDSRYGWSAEYLSDWKLSITISNPDTLPKSVVRQRVVLVSPQNEVIYIDTWNDNNVTIVDWFQSNEAYFVNDRIIPPEVPNGVIDGVPAILLSDHETINGAIPYHLAVFANDQHVYRVRYVALQQGINEQDYFNLLLSFQLGAKTTDTQYDITAFNKLVVRPNNNIIPRLPECGGYFDASDNQFPCCANGGNCTWWARYKRPDFGYDMYEHARYWYDRAVQLGYPVGQSPKVGAVAVWGLNNGFGHVAYVEQVNVNDTFNTSQMDCDEYPGTPPDYPGGRRDEYNITPSYGSEFKGFIYSKTTSPGIPVITSPTPNSNISNPFNVVLQLGTLNHTGLYDFQIQIDNNSDFSSPEFDNNNDWSEVHEIPVPTLPLGTYSLRARQGDKAGGASEWTSTVTFSLRNRPGVPVIVSPSNNSTVSNPFNVVLQPGTLNNTNLYDLRVQIDNNSNFSSPEFDNNNDWSEANEIAIPTLTLGNYFLRARQGDKAGGASEWTSTVTFSVGNQVLDYNQDSKPDVWVVNKVDSATNSTSLHFISGANFATKFSGITLPLHTTNEHWSFAVGDYTGDGISDLWAVNRKDSGSSSTAFHIYAGPTFQTKVYSFATDFGQVGDHWVFAVADYNSDGTSDLWMINPKDIHTNSTYVYVLSGKNPSQRLVSSSTWLHKTSYYWSFAVADYNNDGTPDLWAINPKDSGSNSTAVHIMSGKDFSVRLKSTGTWLHQTADHWSFMVADYDNDGNNDLWGINRNDQGSGSTAIHVMAGPDFQTRIISQGSGLQPTEHHKWFVLGSDRGEEFVINGGFEEKAAWANSNLIKDKQMCNKPDLQPVARTGTCAFRFTGNTGEVSKITQKLNSLSFAIGDDVQLIAYVRGKNISAGGKIQAVIKHHDGTSTKIKLPIPTGSYAYKLVTKSAVRITKSVASVKLFVMMNGGSGSYFLDDLQLSVTPTTPTSRVSETNDGWLPLPSAP